MSMTDRELLELAAKAAGYVDYKIHAFPGMADRYGYDMAVWVGDDYWNPLECNSDAFGLFVTLRMAVEFADYTATLSSAFAVSDGGEGFSEDVIEGDANAAMRRAIVRAAAEVGRRMP